MMRLFPLIIRSTFWLQAAFLILFPVAPVFINSAVPGTYSSTPLILIQPNSGLTTSEDGSQATFTISLTIQPVADVDIALTSSNPEEGEVFPAEVVLTPRNWHIPITITVTGMPDGIVDGDAVYSIVTSPVKSRNPTYEELDPPDIYLTNLDIDTPSGMPPNSFEAIPDHGTTTVNTALTIPVLENDIGMESIPLTLTVTLSPTFGTVTVIPEEMIIYTPQIDFAGQDGFSYQVCSPVEICSSAVVTVTITLTATLPPVSIPITDTLTITETQPITGPLLIANDDLFEMDQGNILVVSTPGLLRNDTGFREDSKILPVQNPSFGELALNNDGSFAYTPKSEFNGVDNFSYQIFDQASESNTATVTILIWDTQLPTVEWTKPVITGEIFDIQPQNVTLEVEAEDNAAIEKVLFYRWDAAQEIYMTIGEVFTSPYRIDLDASQMNPEWNQVFARAYDPAGNISQRKSFWLFVLPFSAAGSNIVGSNLLFLPSLSR